MKKLIVCFFVFVASFVLTGVSLAQERYDLYPPNSCPILQSPFARHLLPDKDFFIDSYPLLDTKIARDIIVLPRYNFDPSILVAPNILNCDPGILFHLNKKDLVIDPGIFVPFNVTGNV